MSIRWALWGPLAAYMTLGTVDGRVQAGKCQGPGKQGKLLHQKLHKDYGLGGKGDDDGRMRMEGRLQANSK